MLTNCSFLEDGKNTDLIRWSDDGNSFIVLDEDEFAKTLIPELFKHNNYASFVRQLNMYGFHKKVGLSDNSMRASERKNKSPSEYSNPYFRRGHPDLLWLIQKPKSATGKKGKKDGDPAEDDDEIEEQGQQPTRQRPPQLKQLGHGESTLSQEHLQSIHQELSQIKTQQMAISQMMKQLKREQEQLYGQAAQYQEQHNRHENSINAILTFLATIYNRSISGPESSQNIQHLFSGAIPESQGTVVDVGDYNFDGLNGADGSQPKPFRKPPLLLTDGQPGRASTVSPSSTNSPFPPRQTRRASQQMRNVQSPQTAAIEEVFDSASNTPVPTSARSENAQPSSDFMSVMQRANARNNSATSPSDFSTVLNNLESASGNTPITPAQREDMIRLMNDTNATRPNQGNGNNQALINSTPPSGPENFSRNLQRTNSDLTRLAQLQAEQDKSVQNLTNLLQPLSPSGSIPGIHDNSQMPPPPLDIDDFLNHNEYFADFPTDGNGNYDFTGNGDGDGEGQGQNFASFNDDDEEEMFGNLPPVNNGNNTGYGYDGTDEGTGSGRVQSLASSEASTPTNAEAGVQTRSGNVRKGRKLSGMEEAPSLKRRKS
jgi:heat shock transcription factor, other eukaryote